MVELWNLVFFKPMLNSLIVLYSFLFNNFGLTIVVFTIIVRFIILPLTLRQLHSSKAMMALQPKIQELQKKYGKDREKLSRETMRLYKEHRVSPLGCLGPMVVQFPVWIALYQAILKALAATPEDLLGLSQYLYSWPLVHELVPLGNRFLWLNLAQPDPYMILPFLVAGSMWVQQKMMPMGGGDPRQQSMNQMMLWMMPMMFFIFTLQFASGLAIFWVVSNVVGIITQYFVTGWGGLRFSRPKEAVAPVPTPAPLPTPSPAISPSPEGARKKTEYGKPRQSGGKRQDRRRSH